MIRPWFIVQRFSKLFGWTNWDYSNSLEIAVSAMNEGFDAGIHDSNLRIKVITSKEYPHD